MQIDRNKIKEAADLITEETDIDALVAYFREGQIEYMESLTDKELKEHLRMMGLEYLLDE